MTRRPCSLSAVPRTGADRLDVCAGLLRGKRLGLITNPSGVNADFISTATLIAERFDLAALFGPEHGVHGNLQAGEAVSATRNEQLGIP